MTAGGWIVLFSTIDVAQTAVIIALLARPWIVRREREKIARRVQQTGESIETALLRKPRITRK